MEYRKHKKGWRLAAWLLFGLYIVLMVYFLFFAESMGRNLSAAEYHYNLYPFREIRRYLVHYKTLGMYAVCLNLIGNVLAFVPFGFFFPLLSRRNRSFWKVTLISFEASLMVEMLQLATRVGSCDVDDIFLNTLGGILGHIGFKIMWHWHWKEDIRKWQDETQQAEKL